MTFVTLTLTEWGSKDSQVPTVVVVDNILYWLPHNTGTSIYFQGSYINVKETYKEVTRVILANTREVGP